VGGQVPNPFELPAERRIRQPKCTSSTAKLLALKNVSEMSTFC